MIKLCLITMGEAGSNQLFDVSRVSRGHTAPLSSAGRREMNQDLPSIICAMAPFEQAVIDETPDNPIAGAVGYQQPFGQIPHPDWATARADLVENVIVIERSPKL